MSLEVLQGDCVEVMRGMEANSVDAIVTDPPYALGFMGKAWDTIGDTGRGSRARQERASEVTKSGQGHSTSAGPYLAAGVDSLRSAGHPFQTWCQAWATEALRVLKPGGHMLVFGGTRTYHRMACGVEDAGFEIRDCLQWIYGSGFPKSLDVSKAIDKAAGAEREVVSNGATLCSDFPSACNGHPTANGSLGGGVMRHALPTTASTASAKQWQGFGTALKPACEPIVLARKPFTGTVAENVQEHGTGGLNITASRIGLDEVETKGAAKRGTLAYGDFAGVEPSTHIGRWPANVVLNEAAAEQLDQQSGISSSQSSNRGIHGRHDVASPETESPKPYSASVRGHADSGGASRFFYTAKASRSERGKTNAHPTVKPVSLMRWLARLVTPPGGTVLDPFAGSGTTLLAALKEGFNVIGIERDEEYVTIIRERCSTAQIGFFLDSEEESA